MNWFHYVAFHDTDELFVPTGMPNLVDFIKDTEKMFKEDESKTMFTSMNFRSRYFPDTKKYHGRMPPAKYDCYLKRTRSYDLYYENYSFSLKLKQIEFQVKVY